MNAKHVGFIHRWAMPTLFAGVMCALGVGGWAAYENGILATHVTHIETIHQGPPGPRGVPGVSIVGPQGPPGPSGQPGQTKVVYIYVFRPGPTPTPCVLPVQATCK